MTSSELVPTDAAGAIAERDKPANVLQVFNSPAFRASIADALPRHIRPDVLMRVALTQVRLQPKLQECTPASFMASLLTAAQLGLRPGLLGEGYLIPRKNGRTGQVECTFQPGYQGLAGLAFRSGEIKDAYGQEVYDCDTFEYQLGDEPRITHIPDPDGDHDPAAIRYFYAVVRLARGGTLRCVMSRKQIDDHCARFAYHNRDGSLPHDSTWVSDYVAMGRKTVLLQALKLAPKSTELAAAIEAEYESVGMNGRFAAAVTEDVGYTPVAQKARAALGVEVDQETGEVTQSAAQRPQDGPQQADEAEGDTVDADAFEDDEEPQEAKLTADQAKTIKAHKVRLKSNNPDWIDFLTAGYGVASALDLTYSQAEHAIAELDKMTPESWAAQKAML